MEKLKTKLILSTLILSFLFSSACNEPPNKQTVTKEFTFIDPSNFGGNWEFKLFSPNSTEKFSTFEVYIEASGNDLKGNFNPPANANPEDGKIRSIQGTRNGNEVEIIFLDGVFKLIKFNGKVSNDGTSITGEYQVNMGYGFDNSSIRLAQAKRDL